MGGEHPVGIAAAIAIAEHLAKTKMPGSVVVFGTPGEEMMPPNAKTVMFDVGVFKGTDVLLRSHASVATSRKPTLTPCPAIGWMPCAASPTKASRSAVIQAA